IFTYCPTPGHEKPPKATVGALIVTLTMRACVAEPATSAAAAKVQAIAYRNLRCLSSGVRANGAPFFPSFMVPLPFIGAGTASLAEPTIRFNSRPTPVHAGASGGMHIPQTMILNLRPAAQDAGLTPRTLGTGEFACATLAKRTAPPMV